VEKRCINVEGMLKAGPYSQAVEAGGFVYISGVVPVDARKGLFITDDIQAATNLVFENIRRVLAAAGTSLDKAVKVTVFLRDMADFTAMNEIYQTYFPDNEPARSCVAVQELPGNFPVEIELVALK
jgi:2-iminobutanoate/2-iminopropanoate deaminase